MSAAALDRAGGAGSGRLLLAALLAALLLAAPASAAEPRASLPDVEDEVMCVQCGTALNVSSSPVSDRERAFIRRQIARGKDKEEIKAALVAEYGQAVLGTPERDGFTLAVWIVPPLLALLGLVGVILAARRWRRRSPPAATSAAPLSPDDARRLDQELAAFDR
jgi:cytochrome c-type biogenesis protein CcmH